MIQYFKVAGQKLVPATSLNEAFWVHLDAPNADEVNSAIAKFEFPEDFITDLQDADELSRLEYKKDAMLIVLRIPLYYKHPSDSVSFGTVPLGIIVALDHIITVSYFENGILTSLLDGTHRPFYVTQQSLTLAINLSIANHYLKFLKEINRRTDEIEKELQKSMLNKELFRMLNMDKSLVFFNTSLKSNQITLEEMEATNWLQMDSQAIDLLENVIIGNKQAIQMADIYSNIISGMMDTFASMISNNLNVVMKFLTSVTIILAVPTLIASIYGMNVHLPMQSHPHAFLGLMGLSVGISLVLVFIFIWKKYF